MLEKKTERQREGERQIGRRNKKRGEVDGGNDMRTKQGKQTRKETVRHASTLTLNRNA